MERMRRLDSQLVLTWSPYSLDPLTSNPIEMQGRLDPHTGEWLRGPVKDPAYYLWRKDECSTHHVFVMTFEKFTNRQVLALERDVARFNRPQDIMRIFHARDEARREKELGRKRQTQDDKVNANEQRIDDLVLGNKLSRRQAKSFSYAGQGNKSTPGDIEMDHKEAGWELPEPE
jgi:hypothetical protein